MKQFLMIICLVVSFITVSGSQITTPRTFAMAKAGETKDLIRAARCKGEKYRIHVRTGAARIFRSDSDSVVAAVNAGGSFDIYSNSKYFIIVVAEKDGTRGNFELISPR